MLRKLSLIFMVGVLLFVGVQAVLAQDGGTIVIDVEDYGTIVGINDGRVNAFDKAAPVAIYYKCGCTQALDENSLPMWGKYGQLYEDTVDGIEILAIDPATGNGNLALWASSEDLAKLVTSEEKSLTSNGVTLNVGDNGWFWVSTAPDFEGKVYTFSWDDFGRTLPTAVK
jgi:hypothetical protein